MNANYKSQNQTSRGKIPDRLYLLDVRYVEPTVIYELVPKPLASMSGATLNDIADKLRSMGVRHILLYGGYPRERDELLERGYNIISGRFPAPPKQELNKEMI